MNSKFKNILFCLFLTLCVPVAHAQDSTGLRGFGVEENILAGKVIKHSPKFTAPIPPLSGALDVNLVWHTYGKRKWQQQCHFPVIGVGMTYTDYGNNKVFGQAIGIYPNIQLPIYRSKKWECTFRLGDGVAYVSRKYQRTTPIDTINTAIGSHINDFAIFMLDARFHVDEHWQLQCGANFTHISNGDYHQPNLGVNMCGIHVGVQYFPVTYKPKQILRDLPPVKNWWVLDVHESISYKEARAAGNPILPTYITSVYIGRHWRGKNKWYFGADYAYHHDVYAFLKNYGVDLGHQCAHAWDGTLFAGNEFLVGRLGLVTQLGVYYRQTFLKFVPVCEKIGGNYYLIKRANGPVKELFLSAMLLTHGFVAEYSEYGIGAGF